eukprot:TRINITY_DN5531_c1_g1_i1.p1 TRINITY_DN5531_c1_g1~~TRINITY_DN5531_c1_g1_i1.p1  ORF type:complete len:393 (+),score=56.89 TRINITY_DN5531_c1_g1_i1:56-1234(+)
MRRAVRWSCAARTGVRLCAGGAEVDADVLVVGAGVVGLAAARALAAAGKAVIVAEKGDRFGVGQSSRNSEVIHAGIYYPPGSEKARLCVAGRKMLYEYCERKSIGYKKIGKHVVATTPAQLEKLASIAGTAKLNGVELQQRTAAEVCAAEPALEGAVLGGLWSSETGIVSTHELMMAMVGDIEDNDGSIAYKTTMVGACREGNGVRVLLKGEDGAEFAMTVSGLVNAAGIHASEVATSMAFIPPEAIPRTHLAKGRYFTHVGKCPFNHLVYPVPEAGGLGVHATLDLGGSLRFGPDVKWVEEEEYTVEDDAVSNFYSAIRSYWPGLKDGSLSPSYAGLRAKIGPNEGRTTADFLIQGEREHGVPGVVNALGIESPGVTSCLAIGDAIAAHFV